MRALFPRSAVGLLALSYALAGPAVADDLPAGKPSRAPLEHCAWERVADRQLGLAAWVQRCDYGFRKIDFLVQGSTLAQRFSDGGAPEPVIDVFDLQPGESPEAGIKRIFAEHGDAAVARRCVPARWKHGKTPPGRIRTTFVPDASYAKELKRKARADEVPDPPCGAYGEAPDGIQYFESQPQSGVAKILFVRVGQDEPLFDEQTLTLLPPG
ncbi:hypothetical protein K2Z84_23735 [Candidatus Binatia bacterium]|nr:hypothetical protein [Candidatus Binatia bacterium]